MERNRGQETNYTPSPTQAPSAHSPGSAPRVQIPPDHRLTFGDGGDGRKGRPKGRFHSGLIGNGKDLMQYAQGHTYRLLTCLRTGGSPAHMYRDSPSTGTGYSEGPSNEEKDCQ